MLNTTGKRKRGGKKKEFTKELYSFRLSNAPATAQEKNLLDGWIAAELPKTGGERARAIEAIAVGLIRHYAGLPVPTDVTPTGAVAAVQIDREALKAEILDSVREWLGGVITDPARFAMLEQARDSVNPDEDDFDLDVLDNILEDFEGRQSGEDEY